MVFLPVNSVQNPNPQAIKIARGNFKSFDALWDSCSKSVPIELEHPQGSGHVFIGFEQDVWMKNLRRFEAHAEHWQGTRKSGSFKEFLETHCYGYFPETVPEAIAA